ncbi:hypothetical protein QQY66_47905 [Streptomyces sp. DG2A-72]|uniref:hypothetical protein n=1 Tax=Streptomyces sp. DG2A-72 TaxID=3051386 RepID=UPI00265C02E3|nr:hypothetical protein [Streptomyces sp. DG2A-72]MDO0939062.1 hypothetical protein [Streptomyces sp. DG2A-72]
MSSVATRTPAGTRRRVEIDEPGARRAGGRAGGKSLQDTGGDERIRAVGDGEGGHRGLFQGQRAHKNGAPDSAPVVSRETSSATVYALKNTVQDERQARREGGAVRQGQEARTPPAMKQYLCFKIDA